MFKKYISLVTLTAFIIFTLSCGSTKYLSLDKITEWEGESIENVYIEKTTGERVRFREASIKENMIVHIPVASRTVSIPLEEVKKIEFSKKNRSKGAGVGFFIGLLAGGLISFIISPLLTQGDINNFMFKFYEKDIHWYTVLGAGIGGGIVLTAGSFYGITDKYILTAPTASTVKRIEIKGENKIEIREKIDTEGGIITSISNRVGDRVDLQESNNYHLFSNIQGFQSAVLLKLPDGRYVFEITTLDEITGEENIEQVIQTESQIEQIRDYIEQF